MSVLTAVRSAGMSGLRRARDVFGGTAVVLAYHRIADETLDPLGLMMPVARFEEQVARFARDFQPTTAGELLAHLAQGRRIPARTVVLTLDDGYTDALSAAKPVLEHYDVPATAFVTSGGRAAGGGFWWDELVLLLLHPGVLPVELELAAGETRFVRATGAARKLTPTDADAIAAWRVTEPPLHPRQALFAELMAFLRPRSGAERDQALRMLATQVETGASGGPSALTRDEIRALARGGLVEVGGHTVSHEVLATQPFEQQRAEIEGGKRALEALLGRQVVSFAYPHGGEGDYTADTVRAVQDAGFLGAFTTRLGGRLPWGSAGLRTPRHEIPRTATTGLDTPALFALVEKRLGL